MDPFSILGIPPDATPAQVRRAYRAMARRHHPDINPGPDATAKMRHINWAYEVLSDPTKRGYYQRVWQPGYATQEPRGFETARPPWGTSSYRSSRTEGGATSTGYQQWRPPRYTSEAPRDQPWGRAYEAGHRAEAPRRSRPSVGAILGIAWIVLWLLNTLSGAIGGGGSESGAAGSYSEDPSVLLKDLDARYLDEQSMYGIEDMYADKIDAYYDDMYRELDIDYEDLASEYYGSLLDDYDQYYSEDEAAFAEYGMDSYVDWPSYP